VTAGLTRSRQGVAVAAAGLTVAYGEVTALEDVDLEVPRGAAVAVLGPNGSGKSTLFSALVGLVQPVRGSIDVGGRRIAYLPQHLNVDPMFPLTVLDTVRMGRWGELGALRRFSPRDHELVEGAMAQLGITDLADRRLSELSGGQRQRALVAQAVAQDAEILLLDEPLTGVDRPTAGAIRELIARWGQEGRTVLVATHDLERSAREYDLVLALNRRVVAFGEAGSTLTGEVLRATFGGHALDLDGAIVDTAGHSDCA
jgi:ABC-type Mn2+/Zn2+ transport system ATPase subunit